MHELSNPKLQELSDPGSMWGQRREDARLQRHGRLRDEPAGRKGYEQPEGIHHGVQALLREKVCDEEPRDHQQRGGISFLSISAEILQHHAMPSAS